MMLSSISKEIRTADTAAGQQHMRKACHNILYVMANSNMFELARVGVPTWIWIWAAIDTVLLVLIARGAIKCTTPKKEKKKKERKKDKE